jgi:hypothetical protein
LTFALLTVLLLFAAQAGAATIQATVLTNLGGVADGMLSGLSDVLQLRAPDEVTVIGPMQQFDIPLSTIVQISVDFPRLVIETETGVVIGPYSSFGGINEVLTLTREDTDASVRIPFASLRALAFGGRALKPVPREWLGDHYLSEPEILAASPLSAETCDDCTITAPPPSTSETSGSTIVWNAVTPEETVEPTSDFPWWIGALVVGALVVLLYFVGSSQ